MKVDKALVQKMETNITENLANPAASEKEIKHYKSLQTDIIKAVEDILALKVKDSKSVTNEIENWIDSKIYEIYAISPKEREVIEHS